MSLPVDQVCEMMDGVRLPDVIYSLLIEKYFDQPSCAALALAGTFDGFSPLYNISRNWKGFVINEQCFYFTPTSWSLFIDQHIALDTIKVFNVNHLYWLPGDLLSSTIMQMENLEELSIKGTQVCTVRQVAKILQSCPKITKLDFTYTEKTQEEIADGLKQENISLDFLTAGFQKLKGLKLSTTVPGPKHVMQDPWLLIIKMLSACRDCTDLAVEVTYTGKPEPPMAPFSETFEQFQAQLRVKEAVERDWLPQLSWMKSLKSLVLVKLGPYATRGAGERVISILLDSLTCRYLFPHREKKQTPRPLQRLWIQDFEVHQCAALKYVNPDNLLSYRSGDCDVTDEKYETLRNIEHLGGMMGIEFARPLSTLKKLKYASGRSMEDGKFYKFCEVHQELEDLSVEHWSFRPDLVNDAICKLPKLKSFSCRRLISKEFVEAMTEAYPILEIIRLTTFRHKTIPPDHQPVLSAFRFPHLTNLSLCNFQLLDGAALVAIGKECPKLEIVHLETDSLDETFFPSNLELFLRQAEKLRDFRLEIDHKGDVYPATAFSILKSLLKASAKLERLALIDAGSEKLPDWKNPPEFADFLVRFTAKMTHMTCCCITFNQMDVSLAKEIKQRVEKEVVAERPSLWLHLDRTLPEASDPGVPAIHYHQIVNPISCVMPRF